MKKRIVMVLSVVSVFMMLSACSDSDSSDTSPTRATTISYPCLQYKNSSYYNDVLNRTILLDGAFMLDDGNSYDIVKTENGYDMVLHFVKEGQ